MSIHVCKCERNGREEWHLRCPGMSEQAAQELADTINGSSIETDLGWLSKENAELVEENELLRYALLTMLGDTDESDYMSAEEKRATAYAALTAVTTKIEESDERR